MYPLKGLFLVLKGAYFEWTRANDQKQVDFLSERTFPISPLVVRAEAAWHCDTSSPELRKARESERELHWCLLDATHLSPPRFLKNVYHKACM